MYMYKLHKSKSNPSKLNVYIPSYNGTKLAPQSSRQFVNRSLSGTKKFGVRQLPLSPASRQKNSKQKSIPKIRISNVNFNVVICNKEQGITSPYNLGSTKSKITPSLTSKANYFKSSKIFKVLNKMNECAQKKKKNSYQNKFDFNPIKVLAKGQYGNLYLAYSKETNFLVVLKSFKKDKVELDFMIDEFKIQLYCKHPNILPSYGFFFTKTQAYLIMQAGTCNLYRQIKQCGFFTEKKAATYIHQVLKGLSYLHLNGIIHRDIKPENIIICGGVAKITDFGWSAITNSQRKTYCGTLDYVSPEVSCGINYDNKIDCWSIGVLAYQMLTGFPPFDVGNGRKERPTLIYKKPTFPTKVSQMGAKFINKMLSIEPTMRMSVTQALRDPWIQTYSEQLKKKTNILHQQQF